METQKNITSTDLEPPVKKQKNNIWKCYFTLLAKGNLPYFWIVCAFITGIATTKIWMYFPSYTERLVGGEVNKEVLTGLSIALILWSIFSGVDRFVQSITKAKIDKNLRKLMWSTMMNSEIVFFDKNSSKEMISRVAYDIESISNILIGTILQWIISLYTLYLCIVEIRKYDIRLVMGLLILFPIVVLNAYVFGKLYFNNHILVNENISKLTQFLSELLNNIPLIKAFSNEEKEEKRGKGIIQCLYKLHKKITLIEASSETLQSAISLASTVIVVVLGRKLVSEGTITIGAWIAYYLYSERVVGVMFEQTATWEAIKSSQGETKRIAEIIEAPYIEYNEPKYTEIHEDDIYFEKVHFGYEDKLVLKDVSFTIPYNKVTAIVGPSGSGKTTIASLIERFYNPESGQIKIGDTDIKNYDLKEWRKSIGYVSQDVPLMSGTIRDNILYNIEREVTEEEFNKVVEAADVLKFVQGFEEGFDKNVGELGSKLSGGQKQRVAIARALLRNPKILILDEATSSLDAVSENVVNEGLEQLIGGCTTIIIAHKISTITNADQIIVLNSGNIEAIGTHEELIEINDLYREFVDLQLGR